MIYHFIKKAAFLFLFALLGILFTSAYSPISVRCSITPKNLRFEYLINPTGQDEKLPRFSWTLSATDTSRFGQRQTAYRILVASSKNQLNKNRGDVWDSGWRSSDRMQHIIYEGQPLQSDQSYYWKVAVKDESGNISDWSETAHWTTGLFNQSEWKARWIGSDEIFDPSLPDCNISDPWMRKTFELKSKPAKANLFIASVGFHEVYVNGKKVSRGVMAPAVTDHTKRARYLAYDLAPELKKGKNVIAVWLGVSWSLHGPYVSDHRPVTPIFIAQAAIYNNRDRQPELLVKSDSTWKTHPSPNKLLGVWNSNKMGGELWDANKEIDNWNTIQCNEANWKPVTVYHPRLILSAQQVETNQLFDEMKPISIEERSNGTYRVDMGRNFAGWTEVKLQGSPGDKIEFFYSERAEKETTFGLHSAYIIGKAGKGTFKNRFNYSSGRWITIKGLKKKPELDDIRGWVARTNFQSATTFESSDTLQNWIYNTVRLTFENLSLGGFVVDCPQRERLGYGGDAHATAETGLFNYKLGAFYTKWMEDWRDVQGTESIVGNMFDPNFARKQLMGGRILNNGILPHTAPTYMGGGGPAWGGIVVTLPWFMYQHEGDTRILEKNFELIEGWLSFLDLNTKDGLLQRFGGKWDFLGDWLWPNANAEGMNNNKEATLCFNNSYRVYNLRTAVKIARVIGKNKQADIWEKQASEYSHAIHSRFFNEKDRSYSDSSMSNLAAALLAEIPPPDLRDEVFQRLEDEISVKRKGYIHVGITGGALLFKLLREAGRDDLIYSMTSKTDYPGWGYMKNNDATTIWEMWEKDLPGHSLLHSSFLYPGAWYIEGMAGIKRDEQNPGFRRFIIRPPVINAPELTWAKASFDSPAGLIKTAWAKEGASMSVKVTVPPNCVAELQLADGLLDMPSLKSGYAKIVKSGKDYVYYELQPGIHFLKLDHPGKSF